MKISPLALTRSSSASFSSSEPLRRKQTSESGRGATTSQPGSARTQVVTRDFVWTYYVSRAPAAEIERALHELEVLDPEPISEPSRALAQWAWSDPRASA